MSRGEHGRGAASEVDCFERSEIFLRSEPGLGKEGVDESPKIGFAGSVLIEGTVGTDAVAKRDVEVEVHAANVEG